MHSPSRVSRRILSQNNWVWAFQEVAKLRPTPPCRKFLNNMGTESLMVKLDISNAFNSLHRDSMLSSVDEILPELAANCHLAYAEATSLQFGKFTVLSQEGSQHGD